MPKAPQRTSQLSAQFWNNRSMVGSSSCEWDFNFPLREYTHTHTHTHTHTYNTPANTNGLRKAVATETHTDASHRLECFIMQSNNAAKAWKTDACLQFTKPEIDFRVLICVAHSAVISEEQFHLVVNFWIGLISCMYSSLWNTHEPLELGVVVMVM